MSCPSWQWHRTGSSWSPVRTLLVAPLWCDPGLVPNSRGNKAAANPRPTFSNVDGSWCRVVKCISFMSSKLNNCSSQLTALGRLSSQANNSMDYVRIFARAVSNPGPPDYSFDDIKSMYLCHQNCYSVDINDMPFTTLLSKAYKDTPPLRSLPVGESKRWKIPGYSMKFHSNSVSALCKGWFNASLQWYMGFSHCKLTAAIIGQSISPNFVKLKSSFFFKGVFLTWRRNLVIIEKVGTIGETYLQHRSSSSA